MIFLLLKPYINYLHIANLFHYITFRAGFAILLSLGICFITGSKAIDLLRLWQREGQPIRDCGPESHKSKAGTPTMGGLIILIPVLITCLLFTDITNIFVVSSLTIMLGFGVLGFIDDYLKVVRRNYYGVNAKSKLIFQLLLTLPICFILTNYTSLGSKATELNFPFLKNFVINLGYFYMPFATVVVIGASNAVNLTDGLDGLAIVPIMISTACFAIISYVSGNIIYANYLQITYIPEVGELTVLCAALIGGCLGFLWYNAPPAQIFMGDTGSLALGGALGIISVMTKHELTLAIVGGLFVIETLSVIIQVCYFKYTGGERFFRMAPIHHHFEKLGWSESQVVIRFWIIAIFFALIGLSSLKLR